MIKVYKTIHKISDDIWHQLTLAESIIENHLTTQSVRVSLDREPEHNGSDALNIDHPCCNSYLCVVSQAVHSFKQLCSCSLTTTIPVTNALTADSTTKPAPIPFQKPILKPQAHNSPNTPVAQIGISSPHAISHGHNLGTACALITRESRIMTFERKVGFIVLSSIDRKSEFTGFAIVRRRKIKK